LIDCNDLYQQLDKTICFNIKGKELKISIYTLFMALKYSQIGCMLPNEMRYEIMKQYVIELKQSIKISD